MEDNTFYATAGCFHVNFKWLCQIVNFYMEKQLLYVTPVQKGAFYRKVQITFTNSILENCTYNLCLFNVKYKCIKECIVHDDR